VAYRVAWEITKNPALRVLYISSTSNLAVKQLGFIKEILTSDGYRFYWPEMVNPEEAKRTKWTESEISVDHPLRKAEAVRDPTIFTAGLTTNITGLHCDISVLDDVVVDETAYTEEGRERVRNQASYLASIAGTGSRQWVVGTRYHPKDLYNDFASMVVEIRDDEGEIIESEPLYEILQREVEDRGDGTGNYLWPRAQRPDGKWFGFDQRELAKKRAQYQDLTRFRAQYYNNPNDASTASITASMFQYFNPQLLWQDKGKWYYKNSRLNVFAAVDFAYSLSKKADYTAIVVIGVDGNNNFYVLDIDRFKTTRISEYFDRLLRLHTKWDFRKLRAEVTAAQEVIVEDLKTNYIRVHGLALTVEPHRPTRHQGTKEERMEAILQPKYANRQMWHFPGGHCSALEEELVLQNPAHDDIKDALAAAIETSVPPSFQHATKAKRTVEFNYHPRFGGIV
jgi:phage terminase large subunit-like protein